MERGREKWKVSVHRDAGERGFIQSQCPWERCLIPTRSLSVGRPGIIIPGKLKSVAEGCSGKRAWWWNENGLTGVYRSTNHDLESCHSDADDSGVSYLWARHLTSMCFGRVCWYYKYNWEAGQRERNRGRNGSGREGWRERGVIWDDFSS